MATEARNCVLSSRISHSWPHWNTNTPRISRLIWNIPTPHHASRISSYQQRKLFLLFTNLFLLQHKLCSSRISLYYDANSTTSQIAHDSNEFHYLTHLFLIQRKFQRLRLTNFNLEIFPQPLSLSRFTQSDTRKHVSPNGANKHSNYHILCTNLLLIIY